SFLAPKADNGQREVSSRPSKAKSGLAHIRTPDNHRPPGYSVPAAAADWRATLSAQTRTICYHPTPAHRKAVLRPVCPAPETSVWFAGQISQRQTCRSTASDSLFPIAARRKE